MGSGVEGGEEEGEGKRSSISRCGVVVGERERERGNRKEAHDEGFTGAVMPAGLRNFGVSELAEESYLNEAG